MAAAGDDAPIGEEGDLVGRMQDQRGRRRDDGGPPRAVRDQPGRDPRLGVGVDGRGGLDEAQHVGVGDEGASEHDALPLAAGQPAALLVDGSLPPTGQRVEDVLGARRDEGSLRLPAGVRAPRVDGVFTGLYMLILYAAILAVPKELEEAARWKIFTQVRFPYIRPVWVTIMIMATTYALRGFDIPYLLTNGGPGQASELLTTYMFKTAFRSTDFGYASTIAVFIVIECIVAVGLIFLLLRRGQDK